MLGTLGAVRDADWHGLTAATCESTARWVPPEDCITASPLLFYSVYLAWLSYILPCDTSLTLLRRGHWPAYMPI